MFGTRLKKLSPLECGGQTTLAQAAPAPPAFANSLHSLPASTSQQLAQAGTPPRSNRAQANVRAAIAHSGRAQPGTPLAIGRAADGICAVELRKLASHLCVTGQPGMGKTTAMVSLIGQLVARGVSVVVLEPAKVEYASALRNAGVPAQALGFDGESGTATLQTNPFLVDEGVLPRVWIQDVCTCIQDVYGLKDQPLPLHLRALVERLYRTRRIDTNRFSNSSAACPTVRDFLVQIQPYLQEETCLSAKLTQDLAGALTSRGRALCQNPAFTVKRGLAANDLLDFGPSAKVLQLSDLGPDDGAFMGMLLLLRVMRASRRLGSRTLHTVFVVEEAHSLLIDQMSGQPTTFARLYESALAELRAAGIGFATIDQRPALLPAGVLANSVTKIALASTHGDDRSAVAKAFALTDDQEQRFGSMGVGEALLQTAGAPAQFVQLGA